jgi:hypothetical protein
MCAKKATSPAPLKPAASATGKAAANGKASATATKPAKSAERTLSHHDIGLVAGEIWGLLAKSDGLSLSSIKKANAAPADVVLAAIGWLAREDKLKFTSSGRTLKISLKE